MLDAFKNKDSFPLFRSVYGSFALFLDNLIPFFKIGGTFSIIFTIVNLITGQSVLCMNPDAKEYVFCSKEMPVMIIANIVLWFVACVYMRNWYQDVIIKNQKFSLKKLLPNTADLKLYALMIVFLATLFVAMLSGFILFTRNPNPDWKIELLFFTVVSVGFFVPMFATPIISYMAFIAGGDKLPKIKETWQQSKGKIASIFISFMGVVLIGFLISSNILRYFVQLSNEGNIFVVVIVEFLYNITLIFVATICINYSYMQKKFLFERS